MQIPSGVIDTVWNDNRTHTWDGLKQTIEQDKAQIPIPGVGDQMSRAVDDLKQGGQAYPSNKEQLQQMLQQHTGGLI